jgi:hypothetical protein
MTTKFIDFIKSLVTQKGDAEALRAIWMDDANFQNGDTILKDKKFKYYVNSAYRCFCLLDGRSNLNHHQRFAFSFKSSDGLKLGYTNDVPLWFGHKSNDPLILVAETCAALYAMACLPTDQWAKQYIDLYNDGPYAWGKPGVQIAWAVFAQHSKMSATAQSSYLTKVLKWKFGPRQKFFCPLTGVILPMGRRERDYVKGVYQSVACTVYREFLNLGDNWKRLDSIVFDIYPGDHVTSSPQYRRKRLAKENRYRRGLTTTPDADMDSREIRLGYWPADEALVKFAPRDERPYRYEKLPVAMLTHVFAKFGKFEKCDECGSYVRKIHDNGCEECMNIKYPNFRIKSYEEDALKYLTIHVKTKVIKPQFPKLTQPILMGCEMEYNCESRPVSDKIRMRLLDHLRNFVIFKTDGSLHTDGAFEMVTAPATLPIHAEKFQPVFAEFPPELVSNDETGMHIHLDRKVVTPLTIGRMLDFLNQEVNKEFIEVISERPLTGYCAQRGYNWGHVLPGFVEGVQRSTVLNLKKEPTIEFRLFQAPVKFQSFIKNLEFVQSMIQFFQAGWTQYTPKESRNWQVFRDFLKERNKSRNEARNLSPNLVAHLKEKGAL